MNYTDFRRQSEVYGIGALSWAKQGEVEFAVKWATRAAHFAFAAIRLGL